MLEQHAWSFVTNALIILAVSTASVIFTRKRRSMVVSKPKETNVNEAQISEGLENSTVNLPFSDDSNLRRENVVEASTFDQSLFFEILILFFVLEIAFLLANYISYILR